MTWARSLIKFNFDLVAFIQIPIPILMPTYNPLLALLPTTDIQQPSQLMDDVMEQGKDVSTERSGEHLILCSGLL